MKQFTLEPVLKVGEPFAGALVGGGLVGPFVGGGFTGPLVGPLVGGALVGPLVGGGLVGLGTDPPGQVATAPGELEHCPAQQTNWLPSEL